MMSRAKIVICSRSAPKTPANSETCFGISSNRSLKSFQPGRPLFYRPSRKRLPCRLKKWREVNKSNEIGNKSQTPIQNRTESSRRNEVQNNGLAKRNTLLLIAAFAAIYILWGSTYLAIKFAIVTLPTFVMTGSRFLVAGVTLFLIGRFSKGYVTPTRSEL